MASSFRSPFYCSLSDCWWCCIYRSAWPEDVPFSEQILQAPINIGRKKRSTYALYPAKRRSSCSWVGADITVMCKWFKVSDLVFCRTESVVSQSERWMDGYGIITDIGQLLLRDRVARAIHKTLNILKGSWTMCVCVCVCLCISYQALYQPTRSKILVQVPLSPRVSACFR